MTGGDRGLQRVGASRPVLRARLRFGAARAPRGRGGSAAGPSARGSGRAAASARPRARSRAAEARGLDLHQRDQAVHLRLVRRESGEDPSEAQRILAELRPHPVVAGGRRVALVEHQVDHFEHRRRAARRELGAARHLERNTLLRQRPLGADDALRDRRLRRPGTRARSRPWSGRRSAAASARRRASVDSTGWHAVNIRRSRSSPMSSSSAVVDRGPARSPARHRDRGRSPRACVPSSLCRRSRSMRAVLGGRHQPRARIVRDARCGPLLERRHQRVLRQFLGQRRRRAPSARGRRSASPDSIRQTASMARWVSAACVSVAIAATDTRSSKRRHARVAP